MEGSLMLSCKFPGGPTIPGTTLGIYQDSSGSAESGARLALSLRNNLQVRGTALHIPPPPQMTTFVCQAQTMLDCAFSFLSPPPVGGVNIERFRFGISAGKKVP